MEEEQVVEERIVKEEPAAEETAGVPADTEAPASDATNPAVDHQPITMPLPLEEAVSERVEEMSEPELQAVIEAIIYVAEEPLTLAQMSQALGQPAERVQAVLRRLVEGFDKPEHGIGIREVAGGYKMATKAEHHEAVRAFVKSLKPPMKLSLPALETLAVIAYKQPVTGPEIMEIRGVQGVGVLKTLLDRKLIAQAGRKDVIGKPVLYKTTKEFLIQFGLKDIAELPSLKEFEEIRRMAFGDSESSGGEAAPSASPEPSPPPSPEAQADGVETESQTEPEAER